MLKKNFLLFTWKNIHEWRRLLPHFLFCWASALLSWVAGDSPERSSLRGIARAVLQLPGAMASRSRAVKLAVINDTEALQRPLGGYFRDTFNALDSHVESLRVLFISPYPICPPIHGGGVFMYQTVHELARLCELHLIVLLDFAHQRPAHEELDRICASTQYWTLAPRDTPGCWAQIRATSCAVREFRVPDLACRFIARYTHAALTWCSRQSPVLGQYAARFRRIANILFEHDVYFQSIARRLPFMANAMERLEARWEYLRSLRWELRMLPSLDRIQVCSRDNGDYLLSFLPQLKGRIDDEYRAGIDTSRYAYSPTGREPFTILFLGSFRHIPNQEALTWFVEQVLPQY